MQALRRLRVLRWGQRRLFSTASSLGFTGRIPPQNVPATVVSALKEYMRKGGRTVEVFTSGSIDMGELYGGVPASSDPSDRLRFRPHSTGAEMSPQMQSEMTALIDSLSSPTALHAPPKLLDYMPGQDAPEAKQEAEGPAAVPPEEVNRIFSISLLHWDDSCLPDRFQSGDPVGLRPDLQGTPAPDHELTVVNRFGMHIRQFIHRALDVAMRRARTAHFPCVVLQDFDAVMCFQGGPAMEAVLREALIALEVEVCRGRIGGYGVRSQRFGFPMGHNEHVPLGAVTQWAREAAETARSQLFSDTARSSQTATTATSDRWTDRLRSRRNQEWEPEDRDGHSRTQESVDARGQPILQGRLGFSDSQVRSWQESLGGETGSHLTTVLAPFNMLEPHIVTQANTATDDDFAWGQTSPSSTHALRSVSDYCAEMGLSLVGERVHESFVQSGHNLSLRMMEGDQSGLGNVMRRNLSKARGESAGDSPTLAELQRAEMDEQSMQISVEEGDEADPLDDFLRVQQEAINCEALFGHIMTVCPFPSSPGDLERYFGTRDADGTPNTHEAKLQQMASDMNLDLPSNRPSEDAGQGQSAGDERIGGSDSDSDSAKPDGPPRRRINPHEFEEDVPEEMAYERGYQMPQRPRVVDQSSAFQEPLGRPSVRPARLPPPPPGVQRIPEYQVRLGSWVFLHKHQFCTLQRFEIALETVLRPALKEVMDLMKEDEVYGPWVERYHSTVNSLFRAYQRVLEYSHNQEVQEIDTFLVERQPALRILPSFSARAAAVVLSARDGVDVVCSDDLSSLLEAAEVTETVTAQAYSSADGLLSRDEALTLMQDCYSRFGRQLVADPLPGVRSYAEGELLTEPWLRESRASRAVREREALQEAAAQAEAELQEKRKHEATHGRAPQIVDGKVMKDPFGRVASVTYGGKMIDPADN